ncbi:hypothetical protein [Mahella australiensis]|uniref:DUF4829 domain-containing protein n=1 Tax=Mahella australiensis (strain DSM 15567 / CIP 107919 / 50-1 BON) TaxID=697281 RepID=F3ZZL6_MAHA5|nr:hypothetical protein [Mahella australiensis]AEE96842.1 hypothetical protein Mahau_1661 [Mahella australiensis 50-1 BON]
MLKILERLAVYTLTRVVLIALIATLLVFSGITAYNLSNIYITVNEAMDKQAQAVLDDLPIEQLNKYFTSNYLNNEFYQLKKRYQSLDIASYKHSSKVHINILAPWAKEAYIMVEDIITDIVLVPRQDEDGNVVKQVIPKWNNSSKRLHMVYTDGRWKIDGVVK